MVSRSQMKVTIHLSLRECEQMPLGGDVFLYHANNNQKLTKTTLVGTIVWQKEGNFGHSAGKFGRSGSQCLQTAHLSTLVTFVYLCDGV